MTAERLIKLLIVVARYFIGMAEQALHDSQKNDLQKVEKKS